MIVTEMTMSTKTMIMLVLRTKMSMVMSIMRMTMSFEVAYHRPMSLWQVDAQWLLKQKQIQSKSFGRSVYTPRTHTVYTSALRYQDRGYSKAKVYTMRTLGALGIVVLHQRRCCFLAAAVSMRLEHGGFEEAVRS